MGPRGSDAQETGKVSVAAQTPEDPGHAGHPRLTLYDPTHPSPEAHLTPGLGSTPAPSQPKALPVSETFHGPNPGDARPQLLNCHPKSFPLGPRPPSAHLSMPVRAPAHLHMCPSSPESPAPALTCPNHLSFKAGCKGHLLQGASPIVPSAAPCSCSLDPCDPISPACLARSHSGYVCLPPGLGTRC